jgi:hypothetical protein
MSNVTRIAMWSGPRNISTALMRSFESRDDCEVVDEPFYAFYLKQSGLQHPVTEEILASQPNDWREVANAMTGPLKSNASVFYQKQMAHHLLPEIEREWMLQVSNAFLIREPRAMLASYDVKREHATVEDLGFKQQVDLYKWLLENLGSAAPVIDSKDVLTNPGQVLHDLCIDLCIDYQPAMLSWEPGLRRTDGIWANHWYDAVLTSTSFHPYVAKEITLSPELEAVAEEAQPYYDYLYERRIGL